MLTCLQCGEEKESEEFHKDKSSSTGHRRWCKECVRLYTKVRYEKNRGKILERNRQDKRKLRLENRIKVLEYLKDHPCVDCGETDPIVLQFDHVRKKTRSVCQLLLNWVWETVEKEIRKCEVRCANCHARKTSKEFGWYSNLTNM
jgi:hypothetical protein